jgi:hypothetical protein
VLQGVRGRRFHPALIRRFGHTLALSSVELADDIAARIANLDDPVELVTLGVAPSTLASDDRMRTQSVAEELFARGATGQRWWSKMNGDWHTVVLFLARALPDTLIIGTPEPLTPQHPAVVHACRQLAIW